MLYDSIKKYIKDDTIKEYQMRFELFNHERISFIVSVDKFNEINNWYTNGNEEIYKLRSYCTMGCITKEGTTEASSATLLRGRYMHLNRSTIAEFSYDALTNKTSLLNKLVSIFSAPVPKNISFFSYLKMLVSVPIIVWIYTAYEKYMIGMDGFSSNTEVFNYLWTKSIPIITLISILFLFFYIVFIISTTFIYTHDPKYIIINQGSPKIYNYVITNFLILVIVIKCILSVTC